jgi:hypothetical protein
LAGCYYDNPYAENVRAPKEEGLVLERAFLSAEQLGNGAPGPSSTTFEESHSIYASAVLSGNGRAAVKFVLLQAEGSSEEMAATQVNADAANLVVTQDITAASGVLKAGTYYVSVKVNGIPSWGVPFTVLPPPKDQKHAPLEQ